MLDSLKEQSIIVTDEISRVREILMRGNLSEERREDLKERLEQLKSLSKMGKVKTSYLELI